MYIHQLSSPLFEDDIQYIDPSSVPPVYNIEVHLPLIYALLVASMILLVAAAFMFRFNSKLVPKTRDYILALGFVVSAAVVSTYIVLNEIYIEGLDDFLKEESYRDLLLFAPSLIFLLFVALRIKILIKNPIMLIYASIQAIILICLFVLLYVGLV